MTGVDAPSIAPSICPSNATSNATEQCTYVRTDVLTEKLLTFESYLPLSNARGGAERNLPKWVKSAAAVGHA